MSNKKPLMSHDPLAGIGEDGETATSDVAHAEVDREQAKGTAIGLPAVLTIAEVGELHLVLQSALQGGGAVEIDGSPVESVDGAGMQLLAGFLKCADEVRVPVTWRAASGRLQQAAATIGLAEALRLNAANVAP